MDAFAASWDVGARCRRLSWLLHAHVVEAKRAQLALVFKAGFNPNQPRVPSDNSDGGQWTGNGGNTGVGTSQGGSADGSVQLAADITGFTKHGINRAIDRGVSPSAIRDAVVNPIQILPQADGTTRYVGAGAVVVLDPLGRVITVWGQ
jgi:hypothetical protein